MRIAVLGAGVIGSVYAGRLAMAGHDVSLVARGARHSLLERDGVHLHTNRDTVIARPRIVTADQLGTAVDLIIVAVRATQLDSVLDLLDNGDSPTVAFLQHLGDHTDQVRSRLGAERVVLAFPGIGGLIRSDGSIEYVEIAAQPTTIDAAAANGDALRMPVASTGMRTALEPDMLGWYATHSVFIACLGAGILNRGGDAAALAGDPAQLKTVIKAIREGFTALDAAGTTVTPTALRTLFLHMPRWFAATYWRRALRGAVGSVAIAPHIRASRDDEFPALCATVLNQVRDPSASPALTRLLAPWIHRSDQRD